MLGSTLGNGELTEDPPLHQHHTHFFFESNHFRQALNIHGDSEYYLGQGVYGGLKEFPDDVGFLTRPAYGLTADTIDVRPPNSAPLEWYAFAGVKLLTPSTWSQPRPRPLRHTYVSVTPDVGFSMGQDDSTHMFSTYNAVHGCVMW